MGAGNSGFCTSAVHLELVNTDLQPSWPIRNSTSASTLYWSWACQSWTSYGVCTSCDCDLSPRIGRVCWTGGWVLWRAWAAGRAGRGGQVGGWFSISQAGYDVLYDSVLCQGSSMTICRSGCAKDSWASYAKLSSTALAVESLASSLSSRTASFSDFSLYWNLLSSYLSAIRFSCLWWRRAWLKNHWW